MRANRGIPRDLERGSKRYKKGQTAFWRNGDVMVQVWKDKTCANDKYDPWRNIVDKGKKDRKTNMEIKKSYAVVQYNKFLKGVHIRSEVKL